MSNIFIVKELVGTNENIHVNDDLETQFYLSMAL